VRSNFADKAEAVQALADLEAEYAGHAELQKAKRTRLTTEELTDAEAAVASASGRRLSTIVSHYLGLEDRARAKGLNLDRSMSFVEGHYRAETKSISVLNAYNEFIANKSGTSDKTETHYKSSLKHLLKPDPNKAMHSFTVTDVEKILGGYTNLNSKRTYRKAFAAFFNWAVRHHYCLENPCDRLDRLPKDMSQITALSLEEVKRLLYAATQFQEGAAVASVVIGIFAGLRPSEIRDLNSEDILEDRIRVSGGKMRRKLKRTVPIPPALAAWLEKYPFKGLPTGWDYKMKELKKATKAKKWVQDIIRHTSLSFQTERDKDEAKTAFHNGTSVQMLNQHYRHTIDDEKIIDEFWSLTPAKLMAKKPEIELPGKPKIKWPSNAALKKLVWEKPLIHAAKEVGVSDVALRKHCVKLGIELPKQGHWVRQQQLSARR
jgi:integrase